MKKELGIYGNILLNQDGNFLIVNLSNNDKSITVEKFKQLEDGNPNRITLDLNTDLSEYEDVELNTLCYILYGIMYIMDKNIKLRITNKDFLKALAMSFSIKTYSLNSTELYFQDAFGQFDDSEIEYGVTSIVLVRKTEEYDD